MEQRFLKNYKVCVSRSERASERARQLCRWDGFENVGFVILDEVKGADDKLTILRFIYWCSIYHFKNTVIINIFMCKLIILFIYFCEKLSLLRRFVFINHHECIFFIFC